MRPSTRSRWRTGGSSSVSLRPWWARSPVRNPGIFAPTNDSPTRCFATKEPTASDAATASKTRYSDDEEKRNVCLPVPRAHPRRLPRARGDVETTISIVIPARNEAARLPRLLTCLAEPNGPKADGFEVIVVNDSSTDGTKRFAEKWGARVLTVSPPPGWTGKSWACQRGAEEASGELLVFLDADTETSATRSPSWGRDRASARPRLVAATDGIWSGPRASP